MTVSFQYVEGWGGESDLDSENYLIQEFRIKKALGKPVLGQEPT